jgi:hypothetical protein
MSMNNEAFKAWLDAMPIDDVRHKIERLETKLADLRVLDRIYSERRETTAEQPEGEAGAEGKPDWQEPA